MRIFTIPFNDKSKDINGLELMSHQFSSCGDMIYFREDLTGKSKTHNGFYNGNTYYEFDSTGFLDIFCKPDFVYKYEFIHTGLRRKLFMDLDFKTPTITYPELTEFVNGFCVFMKLVYNYDKPIKSRIQVSIENKDNIPEYFKSVHIVFDLAVNTHLHSRQIFMDFINQKPKWGEYIDKKVYCANRAFRAVLHAKGGGRTDALYPIGYIDDAVFGGNTIKRKTTLKVLPITAEDLITLVPSYTQFINFEIREDIQTKTIKNKKYHNIKYRIDETKKAFIYLKGLPDEDFTDTKKWIANLTCIESVLMLKGVKPNDILKEPLIKEFLKRSRVGNYNSTANEDKNSKMIVDFVSQTNTHIVNPVAGYFHILQNAEEDFIMKMCDLFQDEDEIIFNVKNINKKHFIEIGDNVLYSVNDKTLLFDYEIVKDDENSKKGKPIKYIVRAKSQYNFYIEQIKNTDSHAQSDIFPVIQIGSYTEVPEDNTKSYYIHGAVGSRKSSLRMNLDIKDILKCSTNRILMVNDTITMTQKTWADMKKLLVDIGLDENLVYHYQEGTQRKGEGTLNNSHRILITCYDSLGKFRDEKITHMVIDEFKNITKRFSKIHTKEDETTMKKQNICELFFDMCNRAVSVKLYDADCDDYLLTGIQKYIKKPFTIYRLTGYTQYNNNIVLMRDLEIKAEISDCLLKGKKITISVGWKSYAIELIDSLTHDFKKRCVLITAEGAYDNIIKVKDKDRFSNDLKINLVKDTNLWKTYDIIIYTPTITTGVSFDEPDYFYKHFAFVGCGADYTQQSQMIFRNRHLESKTICVGSIKDRFQTLKSNISLNDEGDKINHNFKQLCNGKSSETASYYIDTQGTQITDMTDYDKGYNDCLCQIKNAINLYSYWESVDSLIEKQTNSMLLYLVLKSCHDWGAKNIECGLFGTIDENKLIVVETNRDEPDAEQELMTFTDFKNENWINAEFLESCEKMDLVNDGSQKYWNEVKTLTLLKFGFSQEIYIRKKDAIDNWFIFCGAESYSAYVKARNINLYSYKEVIYSIFTNSLLDDKTDLTNLKSRCRTSKEPFDFINKIFALNVAFKIFDLIGITDEDIYDIYDGNCFNIEKAKWFAKIKVIISDITIQNVFGAICAFKQNRVNGSNDEYKQAGILLGFAFKHLGLSIKLNRQDKQTQKRHQSINITLLDYDENDKTKSSKYRIQRIEYTRDSCSMDDIEYFTEDILQKHYGVVQIVYPKIKKASMKDRSMFENWINLFVSDNLKYDTKGILMRKGIEIFNSQTETSSYIDINKIDTDDTDSEANSVETHSTENECEY